MTKENNLDYSKYTKISEEVEKELITLLLAKNKVLHKAYDTKELNVISDYLYQLTSTYSKFYEKWVVGAKKFYKLSEKPLISMALGFPDGATMHLRGFDRLCYFRSKFDRFAPK